MTSREGAKALVGERKGSYLVGSNESKGGEGKDRELTYHGRAFGRCLLGVLRFR